MIKKVVVSRPELNYVEIKDANPDKFYAFKTGFTETGFIMKHGAKYIVPCASSGFANGNNWGWEETDIQTLLSRINLSCGGQIFQFDTAKEMFGWLAGNS